MGAVGGFGNEDVGDISDEEELSHPELTKVLKRIEDDKFAQKIKFKNESDRNFVLKHAQSKKKNRV